MSVGIGRALIVVFLLNGMFFLLALYSALLPDGKVASAARHAFETGALTDFDYLPDSERGHNQYNDCRVIELILNDVAVLDDALAPVARSTNKEWNDSCKGLRTILFKGKDDPTLTEQFPYTRYWFGFV